MLVKIIGCTFGAMLNGIWRGVRGVSLKKLVWTVVVVVVMLSVGSMAGGAIVHYLRRPAVAATSSQDAAQEVGSVDTTTAPFLDSEEVTSKPTAGGYSTHSDFDDNMYRTEVWSHSTKEYMTYQVGGKDEPKNSFTKAIISFEKMTALYKETGWYGRPKLRKIFTLRLLRYWNEMCYMGYFDGETEVHIKRLSQDLGLKYKRQKSNFEELQEMREQEGWYK